MKGLHTTVLVALLALLQGSTPPPSHGPYPPTPAPSGVPSPREPLFAFHSSFWLNLHQFLYVEARLTLGIELKRPSVLPALGDTVGLGALSPKELHGWNVALAYYERSLARRQAVFDNLPVATNDALARLPDDGSQGPTGLDPDLIAALRAAAPAYRTVWWKWHDAANRRWIEAVSDLLADHGDSMAALETAVFHARWPARPIRVDVANYATWAGAYTTTDPDHITIASVDPLTQGSAAFETLFHESMHTMDDSLLALLRADARSLHKRIPRDPTHPFIFFTAGELTRRLIPGHVPYAEKTGIWTRSPAMAAARPVLEREWIPYLDGDRTLSSAVRAVVATWEAADR